MSGTVVRTMRAEAHQRRVMVSLGAACLALTVMALVGCTHVLVRHHEPLLLQAVAWLTGSVALASLWRAASRLVAVARASRRLARTLPLRAGPTVDGVRVSVLDDAEPQAFCLGLLMPRVVLSQGTLARLDGPALAAVVAHERHHARRRDGLRRALAEAATEALYPLPAALAARRRYDVLLELAADRAAVARPTGSRAALAGALLHFDGPGTGVEPERVDGLLSPGRRPAPIPGGLVQGGGLLLGLLALLAFLVAMTGSVDLFVLHQVEDHEDRYEALVVLALTAAALTRGRGRLERRGSVAR